MSDAITRKESLLKSIADGTSSSLKPITREEQYLAYIAGESKSFPTTPITREEAFLDKIAKSGVSGGSSINVQPLTVTENGTWDAPDGQAYDPVIVNVASGGGAELNIAYGDTAPEDTSKLWVKTTKPSKVKVASELEKGSTGNASVTDMGVGMSVSPNYTTAQMVDECIYTLGGYFSGGYQNQIRRLNVQTGVETTLSTRLPLPIANAGTCVYGGNIYLFGGRSGLDNSILSAIYKFDPKTETLTTLGATMPNALYKHTVCVNGTKAYIFGGYYGVYSEFTPSTAVWCYDFETDTISELSISMEAMFQPGVLSYGQYIYIFGGMIGGEFSESITDTIRVLDTVNQTLRTSSAKLPTVAMIIRASLLEGNAYVLYPGYALAFDIIHETITVLLQSDKITALCLVWNDGLLTGSVTALRLFSPNMAVLLASDVLQLHSALDKNIFNLINTDTAQVEIGVKAVYKGNADGIGEQVEASLHDGTSWVTI